ncbi:hypothetical protein [Burkholderia sp. PU8-34]
MRDDRRAAGSLSRTDRGEEVRAKKTLIGLKKQRAIAVADLNQAILEVSAKEMWERVSLSSEVRSSDSSPVRWHTGLGAIAGASVHKNVGRSQNCGARARTTVRTENQ